MSERTLAIRRVIARWLGISSVALFSWGLILFIFSWFWAWHTNIIPEHWGVSQGNHGPWRQNPILGYTLGDAFMMPVYAFFTSGASELFYAEKRWRTFCAVCGAWVLLLFFTHYWFID